MVPRRASQLIAGSHFERHPDGVFISDREGVILDCNERLVEMTGYAHHEIVGATYQLFTDADYWPSMDQRTQTVLAGLTSRFLIHGRTKDRVDVEWELTMLTKADLSGFTTLVRDPRIRVADLDAVSAASVVAYASRLARFSGWSIDVATGETTWGEEMFSILGVKSDAAPGFERALVTFYEEPHRARVEAAVRECMVSGRAFDLLVKTRTLGGDELDARLIGRALRNDVGRIVRVDGAFYDITELVRTHEAGREGERRLIANFDEVTTAIFLIGRDWRFHYANRAGMELARLTPEDFEHGTIWDLFPEVQFNSIAKIYRAAMDYGEYGAATEFIGALEGDFEIVAQPTLDGIMVTARNVTEERLVQRRLDELAERAQFLARMLDVTRDAVMVRNLDDRLTYWNQRAEELYGWDFATLRDASPIDYLYDEADREAVLAAIEVALSEGYWHGELVQRTRDGRRIVVDSRINLLRDPEGQPIATFGVHTDVTESRRQQLDRIRAQRMESLGTLAGGIAHNLNNVLTPMLLSLEILSERVGAEREREMVNSVSASVVRASEMVRQVLTFARGAEGVRSNVPIQRLLGELATFCRDALPKYLEVDIDEETDAVVWGEESQLLQVLVNLATNARDAMPERGRLEVHARVVAAPSDDGRPGAIAPRVVIEVSDTGTGIDREIQLRIFEPFFTTKAVGEGTGLGLSTSVAIVESHGGRLTVESAPGRGSVFRLELACVAATAEDVTVPDVHRGVASLSYGRRILVVDDEESIVAMLRQVLEESGYEVTTAVNGIEALGLVDADGAEFDLVLTDVNMPELDGARLAQHLAQRGATTAVAFMSGVGDDIPRSVVGADETLHFLQKPFSMTQLLSFVETALGDESASASA